MPKAPIFADSFSPSPYHRTIEIPGLIQLILHQISERRQPDPEQLYQLDLHDGLTTIIPGNVYHILHTIQTQYSPGWVEHLIREQLERFSSVSFDEFSSSNPKDNLVVDLDGYLYSIESTGLNRMGPCVEWIAQHFESVHLINPKLLFV